MAQTLREKMARRSGRTTVAQGSNAAPHPLAFTQYTKDMKDI